MNPFQSLNDYEKFLYTITQQHNSVKSSTLIIIKRGKRTAVVQGELHFLKGYRVVIKERLSFDWDQVIIEDYGYEIWQYDQKITWYDSQPHPNAPELASTYPHHKHILPDIKHNRIPAANMSFNKPNLTILIHEVEINM